MQQEQHNIPQTGPEAIEYALSQLTPEQINERGKKILYGGKRSKRAYGVKLLNIARGLERNQLKPSDYMISAVPVIPPKYRPFAAQGDSLIPGDANILYKDLIDVRDAYNEERQMFGDENVGNSRLNLYDAVKSVYGYGDAVKPKTRAKDVQGFLKKITGSTSKFSFVNSKMMAKPQDNVGRSTTIADPSLSIDEIGVPKDMAMTMYAPYVQRRLKSMGYSDADALRAVRDKTPDAFRALERECEVRPVIYSRAPAWYKFNITAGKVKLTDGKALATNPIVQHSYGGDYDGNCIKSSEVLRVRAITRCPVYDFFNVDMEETMTDGKRSKKIKIMVDNNGEEVYTDCVMKITRNTKVVIRNADSVEVTLPIESIPYLPETKRYDKHGAAVYDIPEGISILSTSVDGKGTRWSEIETLTIEEGCSLRKVTTRKGREVTVSSNESLAVFDPVNGLTKIKPDDAMQGQLIPYIKKLPYSGNGGSADLGWLLGLFLSDGTFNGQQLTFTKKSDSIRTAFIEHLRNLGSIELDQYVRTYREMHDAATNCGISGESVKIHINHTAIPSKVKKLMLACYPENIDRKSHTSDNRSCLYKKFPDDVRTWGEEGLLGLLCGLLVGDGSLSINHAKKKAQLLVTFCTSSAQLRDDVLWLGRKLGIGMSYSTTKPKAGRSQVHDSYTIIVSTPDLKEYADKLKLDSQYDEAVALLKEVTDNPHDIVPLPMVILELTRTLSEEELNKFSLTKRGVDTAYYRAKKNPLRYVGTMRAKALDYLHAGKYCSEKLKSAGVLVGDKLKEIELALAYTFNVWADKSTGWEYVTNIEEVPSETVYDVAVPETKVFALENGLVVYDTINVHVPSSDEAVKEAWEKLMPSADPYSDRDTDKLVLLPMQEQILGNYTAATAPATKPVVFNSEEEALKAIKQGQIPLSADVEIRGGIKAASQQEDKDIILQPEEAKGAIRDPRTGQWIPTVNEQVWEEQEIKKKKKKGIEA